MALNEKASRVRNILCNEEEREEKQKIVSYDSQRVCASVFNITHLENAFRMEKSDAR